MDDTAPKPPVRPAKAARRPVRDAAPQAKGKAAGRVPAIVAAPAASSPIATEAAIAPVPSIDDVLTGPLVLPAVVATPAPVPGSAPAPVADATPTPDPIPTPVDARARAPAPIALTAAKEVIMETIETVTAKTQTAFADATAQAKGAVEKSQKMFEDANEFGKGNIEALVESSKIAVRGLEALGQDAAAYAKKSFEEATAAAKTMTSVKSPTELMKLQSDYARSAFDAMVQQTSRNTEAMLKLAGEVVQPLSNRVALAAEKMKVVA